MVVFFRTKQWIRGSLVATAMVVGLGACYPGDITSVEELDLVLTFFDTEAVFPLGGTYVMPDTIIRLNPDGPSIQPLGRATVDGKVLNAIAAELAALGYERVEVGGAKDADVIVLVTSASVDLTTWVPGVWWDYWGWWPGWGPDWGPCCYGPGWGPGYPWAGVPVTQSAGSLMIAMLDPNAVPAREKEVRGIWLSLLSGVLTGTDESILLRVQSLIGQAFDQSPYLDGSGPTPKETS